MKKETPGLHEVIADLNNIKKALRQSGNIFRFIDAGGVLRSILLISGIMIGAFAAACYYLLEQYQTFTAIPLHLKALFWTLVALSILSIGFLKIRNFLGDARKISVDMTLYKLFEEVYSPRFTALTLPFLLTMALVVIFLSERGLGLYIVPFLSLLFGLLSISLSSIFYMREIYLLGTWLAATGLLTLYLAELIHPLAALGLTFSAGFILASLYFYFNLPGEKG